MRQAEGVAELVSESADPPTYAAGVGWITDAGRHVGFPDESSQIVCRKQGNPARSTGSLAAGWIRVDVIDPNGVGIVEATPRSREAVSHSSEKELELSGLVVGVVIGRVMRRHDDLDRRREGVERHSDGVSSCGPRNAKLLLIERLHLEDRLL